jgi:hypothetical protein
MAVGLKVWAEIRKRIIEAAFEKRLGTNIGMGAGFFFHMGWIITITWNTSSD